ncbi:MAG: hypothetical protein ACI956_001423, partial [Nonlabens sp.]
YAPYVKPNPGHQPLRQFPFFVFPLKSLLVA